MNQYDAAISAAIQKAKYVQTSIDIYNALVSRYRVQHDNDLKFLAEMPYEQGRRWVDKTFLEFMSLHKEDPEGFPISPPDEVVRMMRAYRKRKNAEKRKARE